MAIAPTLALAYWSVVEDCLVKFHSFTKAAANQTVNAYRLQILDLLATQLTQAEPMEDLIYHAEPWNLACDLAGSGLPIGSRYPEYRAVLEGHSLAPGEPPQDYRRPAVEKSYGVSSHELGAARGSFSVIGQSIAKRFGLGKKETEEEKEAKALANKLADETPADEQVDLYPQTPQLGCFGEIPPSSTRAAASFIDRQDKA